MNNLRIKQVRKMTKKTFEREGWEDWQGSMDHGVYVELVLEDGTVIYPSRDPEGNGPGALFGTHTDGEAFIVVPPEETTGRKECDE